ncbi:GNAT family N-acetyltransferase [Umezawaea tangerina]|uniref:Putative GNAT family acetyltransferase n=1 Tax=Umezawaea tangerina TaxID=84725 RepID=A0A2T0S6S5_9PSEU|nr:GNAT family N-acetyltransferase [Umezawaea tangerina]PRY29129.1 putative GNAT family acetyltransferase [Umezawaea tangerina]
MPDLVVHDDLTSFWAATQQLYTADPVRHTVALSVITRRLTHPNPDAEPAILVTAHEHGELLGAAIQTPPHPLIAGAIPLPLIDDFVAILHEIVPDLDGVSGDRTTAEAFATSWTAKTGRTATESMSMRLHRLTTLHTPDVPGHATLATTSDLDVDLLSSWHHAFAVEATTHTPPVDARTVIRRQISQGYGHLIWSVGCIPVSWAAASPPIQNMSRISPVYTPPQYRNHGYAAAITAAASTWALNSGATTVLLYTDLANPTSNALYHRLGFTPVLDATELTFTQPP